MRYAIGCSIYGGLFTLGVKRAGFTVLAHLEQDKYGVDTAQLNHPGLEVFYPKERWPARFAQPIDLIFCNPPCAVWSPVSATSISVTTRAFKHWRDDPRLSHAYDALELVERYKPKVWVWESVPQALTRGRSLLLEMVERGQRIGYAATILHIDAARLGVPQRRPRIFVVLSRVAFEPLPCPTPVDSPLTVRDAWKNLRDHHPEVEKTRPQDLKLLPHVKPGIALRRAFDATFGEDGGRNERGQVIGRPSIPEKRLALDRPAIPMMAKAWHPSAPRRITVGEALRLCQLPDDWQFGPSTKNATARKELLQRAVMPTVGEWLARSVIQALKRDRPAPRAGPILYDLRGDEPTLTKLTAEETDVKTTKRATPAERRQAMGVRPIDPLGRPQTKTNVSTHMPPRQSARSERSDVAPRGSRVPAASPSHGRRAKPDADSVERARQVCASEVGSGHLIRSFLRQGRLSDEAIVAAVHKRFNNRKTTVADVRWNRGMLRKAGEIK